MNTDDSGVSEGFGRTPHFLLIVLLFMLATQPIADVAGGLVVRLSLGAVFVASIAVVSSRRSTLIIGLLLGIPALAFLFVPGSVPVVMGGFLGIAMLVYICYVLLSGVFRHPVVTPATISASLVVYLMMGVIWAQAYKLVEHFSPGSFHGLSTEGLIEVQRDLLYYSFVTLTTLGYGDIYPIGAEARSLAITEAVVGQLYLVVLVAGVVGILLSQRKT